MRIKIKAKNSSGNQTLFIDRAKDVCNDVKHGAFMNITGDFRRPYERSEQIQFDFDLLSRKKVKHIIKQLKKCL